ncbi:MAG: PilZ domain-containing protein [Spirochaetes bacterium]|nr:PilZ domain-containing protein [Spirochaetota bacterium]
MDKYIKYEDLNREIQVEFHNYLEKNKYSINDIDIDTELFKWFDEYFESWFMTKFNTGNKKRSYNRVDVEIPVKVMDTIVDYNDFDEGEIENEIIGQLINISRGGMYYRSSVPVEKSSIIKIKVKFSEVEKNADDVEALAMVMRVDKLANNEYGIGLMFSTIYDVDKKSLYLFIFHRLVEILA